MELETGEPHSIQRLLADAILQQSLQKTALSSILGPGSQKARVPDSLLCPLHLSLTLFSILAPPGYLVTLDGQGRPVGLDPSCLSWTRLPCRLCPPCLSRNLQACCLEKLLFGLATMVSTPLIHIVFLDITCHRICRPASFVGTGVGRSPSKLLHHPLSIQNHVDSHSLSQFSLDLEHQAIGKTARLQQHLVLFRRAALWKLAEGRLKLRAVLGLPSTA